MLDNETKRRIDSARDILVGKVPDPKSQVEQITIALIYKFMDDMDKEAIEFGGKASFFTGEYEKYGWSKIFDPRLGGYEMLSLYGEAIEKLDQNPNIPQLFRDIFKNAYLPYRDPETLKLFLKTINDFHYDHSEKLGDAFEYLLSVLGSQGDAGQFRTPRHIIDFIVDILQPKKNETILDPACGTAGFLISSYKYMLKENTNKTKGDLLTPADRKKLMNNFNGYDISPDMVRLSLVNMYLHNFTSPKIYEYDTLTSEDRWGDYFDIIMANPPFMTPKGGIKPHKKFTMQANRSEVLFVDYIAEHINSTTGRAGVIVPEGIIFQSATAYKALRKLLVDKNYLYAVVSLPAGIFQPYSGVKTSILLMDKTIAKKTDKILFIKIENDGFDLGAQRKPIDKNDLSKALELTKNYQSKIQSGESFNQDESVFQTNYLLVEKEKIKANVDYNLSMDKYRVNGNLKHAKYEMVKLGQIGKICMCKRVFKEQTTDKGDIPFYKIGTFGGEPDAFIRKELFDEYKAKFSYPKKGDVLISTSGTIGKIVVFDGKPAYFQDSNIVWIANDETKILNEFLKIFFQQIKWQPTEGVTIARLYNKIIEETRIPLPPLSIQQEIVHKIEGWQKIVDGAKQIIENYKPQIYINPDWKMVKLGDVCEFVRGPFGGSLKKEIFVSHGYKVYEQKNAIKNDFYIGSYFIDEDKFQEMKRFEVFPDDIIISCSGTMGKIAIAPKDVQKGIINQALLKLTANKQKASAEFIKIWLETEYIQAKYFRDTSGAAIQNVSSVGFLKEIPFPNLSLSIQQQMVNQIEQEQQLINANKQLIQIFEQKIKDEINKLWQTDTKEYSIEDEQLSLVGEE